ncbi:MAG: hypothetical protein COX02_02105 [Candidatus Vogelbacteria bacterium CG22_combo_CG10-13_8_21_14_all_37_9]|uniref:Uncharacterized protein n=1 Tax=Candidatus Vogelbacteria bacterium CG22_combo_CG10-13_8_21_14_all_37_9 TaxID=1975046 RepID=A0A2H0BK91_9BACT|nr:MAG: hypothetical protein COX02_02105 [Candidatus Vogelbacteria bacterium CG22_combo_CG10-13_8_21_14_all_37_9]
MDNYNLDQVLKELKELSKENNKLLHDLHRNLWWGRFFGFIRWAVIIGSAVGFYYYFQPVLDGLIGSYQTIIEGVNNLSNF